jgi:CRISPR-associated protein Csb2
MRSVFVPEFLSKRLGSSVDLALEYVGPAGGLDPRLVGPSRRWRSLTPVTSTRHRKRRESWDNYVEGIVRRELGHRGLPSEPDNVGVEIVPDAAVTPTALRSSTVYRARTLGRDRQQAGSHVVVEFATPVSGPLAIGSLAHFGLGTLVVDEG